MIFDVDLNAIITSIAIPALGAILWLIKRVITDQLKGAEMSNRLLNDAMTAHQLSDKEQHAALFDKTTKQSNDINEIKLEIRGLCVKFESLEEKIELLIKLSASNKN